MVDRITVSIEKEFVEELKSLANQEEKSLSSLVREALEEWLISIRKKRAGKTLLALLKEKSCIDEKKALKAIETMRKQEW